MILLLLTLSMGIPLDMIQIEVILQTAPHPLQKPLIAQQFTFAFLRLLFRTVPASAELTDQATIQNHYSRKARGQDTVHKQWPVTVHSNSTPDRIMKLLFAFGWQDNSPEVKAIYLPWFQLSSEGSKALSSYIRHPWHQSSSDSLGPFRLLKVIEESPLALP